MLSFQKIIISIALKTVGFGILKNPVNTLCVEISRCIKQVRIKDFIWSELNLSFLGQLGNFEKGQACVFISCTCICKVNILHFGQKYVYFGSKFVNVAITTDKVLFFYQLCAADTQ